MAVGEPDQILNLEEFSSTTSLQASVQIPFRNHDEQLQRDIHLYRLKYIFNCSCSTFIGSVRRRIPAGRAAFIILIMIGLEQLAYTSALEFVIYPFLEVADFQRDFRYLIRTIGLNLVADLLFPFTGWLADVWVGRYNMMHMSSWVFLVGYSLAAVSISFGDSYGNWNKYILLPCFIAINVGSAGFQANAIPFGADQIAYKTSHELSSYFYLYYCMRNLGAAVLFMTLKCHGFADMRQSLTYIGIGVVASTIIVFLTAVFKADFLIDKNTYNPLKKIFKVTYLSVTIRRPVHRSAFSYNTEAHRPSRLDLTKQIHGGKFDEEMVEDVKTFYRLVSIMVTLFLILVTYTGVSSINFAFVVLCVYVCVNECIWYCLLCCMMCYYCSDLICNGCAGDIHGTKFF